MCILDCSRYTYLRRTCGVLEALVVTHRAISCEPSTVMIMTATASNAFGEKVLPGTQRQGDSKPNFVLSDDSGNAVNNGSSAVRADNRAAVGLVSSPLLFGARTGGACPRTVPYVLYGGTQSGQPRGGGRDGGTCRTARHVLASPAVGVDAAETQGHEHTLRSAVAAARQASTPRSPLRRRWLDGQAV
eukprot:355094-Chlamydomonas_euryale.AAC.7